MRLLRRPPSLAEKTEEALALLREARARHDARRIAVAYTGGKDSTLALFFWRKILAGTDPGARVLALNLDTGVKFPEALDFRDRIVGEWGVRLHVARPASFLVPLAADKAACCGERKIAPLLAALEELDISLLITGIRADEHPSRGGPSAVERRASRRRLHPLLHFTEMDVWAATQRHGLPWCPLYNRGYRSLGCVPCTALPGKGEGERSGRAPQKETVMEDLRAIGYF